MNQVAIPTRENETDISNLEEFEIPCDVQNWDDSQCPNVAVWGLRTQCTNCWRIFARFWCEYEMQYQLTIKKWECRACKDPEVEMNIIGTPFRLK